MNSRENENGGRDFSIELDSGNHRFLSSSDGANGGVLIEGTLGRLQHASFVEPEILEVKGSCGVLRVNLRMSEITVIDTVNKCVGGETE